MMWADVATSLMTIVASYALLRALDTEARARTAAVRAELAEQRAVTAAAAASAGAQRTLETEVRMLTSLERHSDLMKAHAAATMQPRRPGRTDTTH